MPPAAPRPAWPNGLKNRAFPTPPADDRARLTESPLLHKVGKSANETLN
jgi:hypothetical protein